MYEKSCGLEWLSGVVRRGKERRRVEETVGGVGVGGVVGGVRAAVKNTKPGMSLDSSSHCAKLYYVTGPFWLKVLFSRPESRPSTCGVFWWLLRGGGTRRRRFGASWRRSSWYPQSGGLNSCRMQLCWSVFRRQNFASLFKQASALRERGPTCVVKDWFFARWRLGPSSGFFSYSFP